MVSEPEPFGSSDTESAESESSPPNNMPEVDSPNADAAQTPDAESRETDQADSSSSSLPLPPLSLSTIVGMLSTPAMMALGMFPGPDGKPTEVDTAAAKRFIDLLQLLQSKFEQGLEPVERKFIDDSIHSLRMAYLDVSKSHRDSPPG